MLRTVPKKMGEFDLGRRGPYTALRVSPCRSGLGREGRLSIFAAKAAPTGPAQYAPFVATAQYQLNLENE